MVQKTVIYSDDRKIRIEFYRKDGENILNFINVAGLLGGSQFQQTRYKLNISQNGFIIPKRITAARLYVEE